MKLQLLVPQYHETDAIIKPLLDSIAIQQNVNFDDIEMIICNDGSNVYLTSELLTSYPFNIKYYLEPHSGVSGTRNACLNYATADYVMFCDADDMFMNVCGLFFILQEADNGFDLMTSCFIEEIKEPLSGAIVYYPRENDVTFVHGKIYNRHFLIDNNIFWNEQLTIDEDSYFNCLCDRIAKNIKYSPTPFYLWKWRDDSVCRKDLHHAEKTFTNLLDSNACLINTLLAREHEKDAQDFVVSMVYDSFLTLHYLPWLQEDSEGIQYRIATEKRFAEYYADFKHMFESAPRNIKIRVANIRRKTILHDDDPFDTMAFAEWISFIKKQYINS